MVLAYYAARAPEGKAFVYFSESRRDDPPIWFLRNDFAQPPDLAPAIVGPGERRYTLAGVFPYAGLSGWNWMLYRRAE